MRQLPVPGRPLLRHAGPGTRCAGRQTAAGGPLHDIGRQAGGVLAERLAAGGSRSEVFTALIEELSGPRQRRRVVVVEDVHWADEATLDTLVFLGRRIERLPALLVLTYRDDEVGTDHPLRTALSALPRTVLRTVPVPPLSRQCVAEQALRAGRSRSTCTS